MKYHGFAAGFFGLLSLFLFSTSTRAQPIPVIGQQPSSQSLVVGSNATFSVTATGQSPDYYWFFNGTNLVNGGRISGANSAMLNIANITGADAGGYYVLVSNRHGTATSSTATLTVLFPPEIAVQPIAQSVVIGNSASFSVAATGTAPLSYRWQRNGADLLDDGRIEGATTANLVITDVETTDAGNYSVIVSNAVGVMPSDAVALTVLVPPSIVQEPVSGSFVLGASGSFSIEATGDAPLSYTWFFNNTPLADDSRIQGANSPTLNIAEIQGADAGTYFVVVTNAVGSATSAPVELSVLFPATIVQHPVSLQATNGRNFALSGTATGTQPITYQWFFNNNPLSNSQRVIGAGTASLAVQNVETGDAGDYFLVASNAYGSATSEVAVVNVVVPPVIVQQPSSLTRAAGQTALFSVTTIGDEPKSYAWFRNGVLLSDDGRRTGTTTSALIISNLVAGDAGDYSVRVTNPYGVTNSTTATLTVILPPTITIQPGGRSAPAGLPVNLSVAATGGSLHYQWRRNGNAVAGATTNTLHIPVLTVALLGGYDVIITNIAGSVTSSVAQVTFGSVAAWGRNLSGECNPPANLTNAFALSGLYGNSFALKHPGELVHWGGSPALTNPTPAVAVAASSSGAIILKPDGRLQGLNMATPNTSNVVAIAVGQNHVVALRREGVATSVGPGSPMTLNNVAAIAAGTFHSLALKSNGTVVAWGTGPGTNVPPGLKDVTAITAGNGYSLALRSNGTVVAWGNGTAATVPPALSNVVAISANNYSQSPNHNLALRADGTVVAWGNSNAFGELSVPTALSNVVSIYAAPLHSLAIVGDGRPLFLKPPVGGSAFHNHSFNLFGEATGMQPMSYQWSFQGQPIAGATNKNLLLTNVNNSHFGPYTLTASNALGVVTSVPAFLTVHFYPATILSLATNETVMFGNKLELDPVVIGSSNIVYQWRKNGTNILGATNRVFSIQHASLADAGTYTLIVSNHLGTASANVNVQVRGPLIAWGSSNNGVTNIPPGLTNVIAVSSGSGHVVALRSDGTVVSWGSNLSGQTNVPPGLSNVVEVSAGGSVSAALRADGTVATWGGTLSIPPGLSNIVSIQADYGGLSFLQTNGAVTKIGSGYQAPSHATNIVALAGVDDGHFGIRADGTFYYVGSGSQPPPPTNNVMQIGAARYHGVMLRRDGSVLGWGSPGISNQVSDVISVASTGGGKFAVDRNGTVICLGGLDVTTNVPPGLSGVSVLEAGYSHVIALSTPRDLNGITLSQATDTTNLVLSSKSSPQWYAQTRVTKDGLHAAQSAKIGSNTASSMRMFVAGPRTVRFWWKVSSQTNSDFLSFSVSGNKMASISGEVDWEQRSIAIPAGRHLVTWTYSKDSAGTAGADAGWVDQIEILPPPPVITQHPLSHNVLSGNPVRLLCSASGTPPLSYQWFKDGVALPPTQNHPVHFIPSTTRSHSGTYWCAVTDANGTTISSNAIVQVKAPQIISNVVFTNGQFVFTSSDSDGGTITESHLAKLEVLVSTNLLNWEVLPNSLTLTNGTLRLLDTEAAHSQERFYRIRENW